MILLGCHLPADVYQFAPIFSFFLDSILKSRDTALPTKVHIVKDTVFLAIMYGCESWIIKKAVKMKVTQLCPTLCDPIDYTVHGILQARILE